MIIQPPEGSWYDRPLAVRSRTTQAVGGVEPGWRGPVKCCPMHLERNCPNPFMGQHIDCPGANIKSDEMKNTLAHEVWLCDRRIKNRVTLPLILLRATSSLILRIAKVVRELFSLIIHGYKIFNSSIIHRIGHFWGYYIPPMTWPIFPRSWLISMTMTNCFYFNNLVIVKYFN